jgi:hypothetical protein
MSLLGGWRFTRRRKWPDWMYEIMNDPLWDTPQLLTEPPDHREWISRIIPPAPDMVETFWICERRARGLHIVVTRHETWEEAWLTSLVRVFPDH